MNDLDEDARQREFEKYCQDTGPNIKYMIVAFVVGFVLVQVIRIFL